MTINPIDSYTWAQFAPSFALVIVAAVILMADSFLTSIPRRGYALIAGFAAIITAFFQCGGELLNPYAALACFATGLSLLISYDYSKVSCAGVGAGDSEDGTGELYALPLIAAAGICALTQASDLIMLFVSLEVVTLSSYVLAGYYRRNQGSIEAGIKYLVLGAFSTGILVFGAAWYYGMTGSFQLDALTVESVFRADPAICAGFLVSMALLSLGICFKVGAVPMHSWIPDVYQGAPTPVSAFLAVASKTAGFAALLTIFNPIMQMQVQGSLAPEVISIFVKALAFVIVLTLLVGNLGAINQRNAKRLLGYSSIGQAGFILVFFLDYGNSACFTIFTYLLAYGLATIAAFAAIAVVRKHRESEEISAFQGLGSSNPFFAFLVTISMASLAGVPLTFGFIAKLESFKSLITASSVIPELIWILPVMILAASVGFYYYFKILRAMYWDKAQPQDKPVKLPLVTGLVMSVCCLLILLGGTLPLILKF